MKKTTVILTVLMMLFSGGSSASAGIRIKRISFDPAGADSGTNRHLNKEFVYLVNTGRTDVQLRGWKVFDRGREHVFRFGPLLLGPDQSIHLRTGRGSEGAPVCEVGTPCGPARYDFYWDLESYVWNNDGDRATLIRRNGNIVDRCSYGSSADSPKRC